MGVCVCVRPFSSVSGFVVASLRVVIPSRKPQSYKPDTFPYCCEVPVTRNTHIPFFPLKNFSPTVSKLRKRNERRLGFFSNSWYTFYHTTIRKIENQYLRSRKRNFNKNTRRCVRMSFFFKLYVQN